MSEALIIPESAKSYAEICLSAISQHKESLAGDTYELLDNLELADEEVILKVLTSVSSMDIYDKIAIKKLLENRFNNEIEIAYCNIGYILAGSSGVYKKGDYVLLSQKYIGIDEGVAGELGKRVTHLENQGGKVSVTEKALSEHDKFAKNNYIKLDYKNNGEATLFDKSIVRLRIANGQNTIQCKIKDINRFEEYLKKQK